jgi:phosphoglycolate phosphatase
MDLAGATIVFDLDGTLVDTAPDILRALAVVLESEGLATPPEDMMRVMVGHGARRLIERAARWQSIHWPDEKLDLLTEDFVAAYAADIARLSRPFPGTLDALEALRAAGATLSVCTNKRTGLSVQLLEALGMADRFGAIIGADAVPARKPDPGHYRAAVAAVGGRVECSLMVGDGAPDVSAAHAAGAPVVAVRFGYCEEGVETLGADVLIDSYAELGPAARKLLLRR